MLVHALCEDAKGFYLRLGLEVSPLEPMTLDGHGRRLAGCALGLTVLPRNNFEI